MAVDHPCTVECEKKFASFLSVFPALRRLPEEVRPCVQTRITKHVVGEYVSRRFTKSFVPKACKSESQKVS